PQYQPDKAKRSSDEECYLPPMCQAQPNDQRWRNHGTNSGSTIEDSHPKSPLANGKPLRHGLGSARPVPCLTKSEDKTKDAEAGQTTRERVRHRGNGPKHNRTDEASLGANAIVKLSGESLADGVSQ